MLPHEHTHTHANLVPCSVYVAIEAEERAKRDAAELAQQEAMEPQEVRAEPEQPEPKEDEVEGEEPEPGQVSRPADGNTGGAEPGSQPGSATRKNPPLQNGTSLYLTRRPHSMIYLYTVSYDRRQFLCCIIGAEKIWNMYYIIPAVVTVKPIFYHNFSIISKPVTFWLMAKHVTPNNVIHAGDTCVYSLPREALNKDSLWIVV